MHLAHVLQSLRRVENSEKALQEFRIDGAGDDQDGLVLKSGDVPCLAGVGPGGDGPGGVEGKGLVEGRFGCGPSQVDQPCRGFFADGDEGGARVADQLPDRLQPAGEEIVDGEVETDVLGFDPVPHLQSGEEATGRTQGAGAARTDGDALAGKIGRHGHRRILQDGEVSVLAEQAAGGPHPLRSGRQGLETAVDGGGDIAGGSDGQVDAAFLDSDKVAHRSARGAYHEGQLGQPAFPEGDKPFGEDGVGAAGGAAVELQFLRLCPGEAHRKGRYGQKNQDQTPSSHHRTLSPAYPTAPFPLNR